MATCRKKDKEAGSSRLYVGAWFSDIRNVFKLESDIDAIETRRYIEIRTFDQKTRV